MEQQPTKKKAPRTPRKPPSSPTGEFELLLENIQRALGEQQYVDPTPIQRKSIPPVLAGRDLLGAAQTGTGKTAAFTLPILQYLTENERKVARGRPRALILAPTRELAAQIGESIEAYGRHLSIRHTVIFGGVSQGRQVQALGRGLEILVATPGRLLDLMGQGYIELGGVEVFVLDEADRMLDMGFIHDIRKVIAKLPKKRQTLFFSATMPKEVVELSRKLVHDPVEVSIEPEKPAVDRIDQSVLFVEKRDKARLLVHTIEEQNPFKVIVFTQMKHTANRVARKLLDAKIAAAAIHGNKSQNARTQALDGFKSDKVHVLVATDVAARGIDVDGITHVVNYDLPQVPETYIHRIGRTARAGASGEAISFCCPDELEILDEIERAIRRKVTVVEGHPYHAEPSREASRAAAKTYKAGMAGKSPPGERGRRPGGGKQSRTGKKNSGKKRSPLKSSPESSKEAPASRQKPGAKKTGGAKRKSSRSPRRRGGRTSRPRGDSE